MSKVRILPPEIISKIAAGEVIERPASVVKELIENAIDAGAENMEISLEQGGKKSICLKDTGVGIEPDDIEKIFKRHSTSKIQTIDDLFSIQSLGFRGEALYSIAAIADVTLRSKTESTDTGWEIHLRGGERINLRPVSMARGTEIEVKELFFNTPARKKFLKTDTTELQQILNIFTPYSILYPKKRLSLQHNGKTIIDCLPEESHTRRIEKALGLSSKYIWETQKDFPEENISIRLFLGDINIQRAQKNLQFVFVNNRPVQNRAISFHANQVYRLILPPDLHPFFSIHLNLPSENIDVNVHPTKREVKIKNEAGVIPRLRAMCEQTLMSCGRPKEIRDSVFSFTKPPVTYEEIQVGQIRESSEEKYRELEEERFVFPEKEKSGLKNKLISSRYIGSFLKKYLFFESGTCLIIIDQHAAQERITYEQLVGQIESDSIEIQHLVTPYIIKLSPQEMLIWEESKEILEKIGLTTTLWGNEDIALHTHPQLLKKPEIAVHNILSGNIHKKFDIDTVARYACRNSIMAGDKMDREEAEYLCKRLVECKDPFVCPHGRPTVVEVKDKVFEKEFLRR